MQFRIVSALKVSSSNNDESGYDAMKMFKQNNKKIFTAKEIEEMSKEDITKSKSGENNIDSGKKKQIYLSSDDNDSDQAANTVLFKKRKKNMKYFGMNQESDSKVENVQNIEDCENQSRRQTILLSATLTQAVEKLAGLTMHNPIFVDAAKENLEASGGDTSEINEDLIVPQSVIQSYIVTPPKLRMVTLSAYIAGRCQVGKFSVSILPTIQHCCYDLRINSVFLFSSSDSWPS